MTTTTRIEFRTSISSKFHSLPWNQQAVIGYALEIFFDIIVAETYLTVNGVFLLLFISMCFHHQAFHRMFRHSLIKFEGSDEQRIDKKQLCNLINFHLETKE